MFLKSLHYTRLSICCHLTLRRTIKAHLHVVGEWESYVSLEHKQLYPLSFILSYILLFSITFAKNFCLESGMKTGPLFDIFVRMKKKLVINYFHQYQRSEVSFQQALALGWYLDPRHIFLVGYEHPS